MITGKPHYAGIPGGVPRAGGRWACDRFFRRGYVGNLTSDWLSALCRLDGGQDKLRAVGARRVVTDADFSRFRQVADTPFNLVYEVRP